MVCLTKKQRREVDCHEPFSVSLPGDVFDNLKDDMVSGSFSTSLLPNGEWCDDVESVTAPQLVFEVEVSVLTVLRTSWLIVKTGRKPPIRCP
jgi:hypothetical protein